MATIVDKDEAIELLRTTWGAIDDLYTGLTEDRYLLPTTLPGWTVKDQLSHIAGAEQGFLGEPAPDVDVTHLTDLRNDIAKMNEVWVEDKRRLAGAAVLDTFRSTTRARLAVLEAMTQADFDAPSWTPAGPDETYGRFMRIRAYDSFMHEHDARAALGAPDRDDPLAVRSALDEIATAIGYIVGRKAAMPAGSRVRIELTGAVPATFLVEVTDRARLVDSFDGEPSVALSLPVMTFLRLTGGRVEPEPLLASEVERSGDLDLATQLATNLAFTI